MNAKPRYSVCLPAEYILDLENKRTPECDNTPPKKPGRRKRTSEEDLYARRIADFAGLGQRIHELRAERGWSAGELSYRVDCSEMHIFHLEHGRRRPSYRLFVRLAEAFEISCDELLTDPEAPDADGASTE